MQKSCCRHSSAGSGGTTGGRKKTESAHLSRGSLEVATGPSLLAPGRALASRALAPPFLPGPRSSARRSARGSAALLRPSQGTARSGERPEKQRPPGPRSRGSRALRGGRSVRCRSGGRRALGRPGRSARPRPSRRSRGGPRARAASQRATRLGLASAAGAGRAAAPHLGSRAVSESTDARLASAQHKPAELLLPRRPESCSVSVPSPRRMARVPRVKILDDPPSSGPSLPAPKEKQLSPRVTLF